MTILDFDLKRSSVVWVDSVSSSVCESEDSSEKMAIFLFFCDSCSVSGHWSWVFLYSFSRLLRELPTSALSFCARHFKSLNLRSSAVAILRQARLVFSFCWARSSQKAFLNRTMLRGWSPDCEQKAQGRLHHTTGDVVLSRRISVTDLWRQI